MGDVEKLRQAYRNWNDTRGGSVAEWLSLLADDVVIRSLAGGAPGMDFSATRRGLVEAERYFAGITADWEMIYVTADEFIAAGDRVAVLGRVAWKNRRTGRTAESPTAHFWRFRDGKVVEYNEFYDTAAGLAAARPD